MKQENSTSQSGNHTFMNKTFEAWMKEVDRRIEASIGLSSADLPDICYRDMYADGATPASAAREAIKGAME